MTVAKKIIYRKLQDQHYVDQFSSLNKMLREIIYDILKRTWNQRQEIEEERDKRCYKAHAISVIV
jgi:hypothetical protein